MGCLDELLAPLLDAAELAIFPLHGDGREGLRPRLQAALAEALRGTVTLQGGQEVDGERLTPESCLGTAEDLYARAGNASESVKVIAGLLQQVREADQREQWIRDGYAFDSRLAWERAEAAERRAAELEQALRLVKRATRDVKVGRG